TISTRDWSSDVCSSDLKESGRGFSPPLIRFTIILRARSRFAQESPSNSQELHKIFSRIAQDLVGACETSRQASHRPRSGNGSCQIGRASCREGGESTGC